MATTTIESPNTMAGSEAAPAGPLSGDELQKMHAY